jgi:hypothetical protein
MQWLQITYYSREGASGAVRCTAKHLEATKQGIISGFGQVLTVEEVKTDAVPVV